MNESEKTGATARESSARSFLEPLTREPLLPRPTSTKHDWIASALRDEQVQRHANVQTWSALCDREAHELSHEVQRFERELTRALHTTEHLGSPNVFRTAVCFDVLHKISAKFKRFEQVVAMVRKETECAVYLPKRNATPDDGATAIEASFERKAYFTELGEVLAEKQSLERELTHLDDLYAFMQKQLRNNEQMVDRLAQRWARVVMKQTLVDWRKIIIRKKYTRVLLEKTSGRWSKQRLQRLFRRWAAHAGAEKIRKTKQQLAHYQDHRHDFQDLVVKLEQQIESAKQESRTNREHVDFAKRQLLSLDDLLRQLELRIRQSNERKLQSVVNQWGALCFTLVDCEVTYLQNMLDAVNMAQYVDVTMLVRKGEELSELLNLPSDVLVLRWINFQLSQCPTFDYYVGAPLSPSTGAGGFIQNFTSDMHRNYVLRHILKRILTLNEAEKVPPSLRRASTFVSRREGGAAPPDPPHVLRPKILAPFANREELRVALSETLDPACPSFLIDQVVAGDPTQAMGDLVFCLFSFLVCEHPHLQASTVATSVTSASHSSRQVPVLSTDASLCPWHDAQVALDEARAVWERVREQWTELQTPFEVQETTKTKPDVTSPPQLLVKANIALQNAVNMVQYACSKRSVVMKTWGCVQRKIQQDALRLLLHRGRNEPPMVLLDRRVWREKYMLTTLHIPKLVAQFAHIDADQTRRHLYVNSTAKGALEAELQDVELVLEEHYEALRLVYRYYASIDGNRQGRGHSQHQVDDPNDGEDEEGRFFQKIAMSMSLLEFHTFLKDCRFFGTKQPFPYEFIQQAFAHVNVEVAAGTDAAMLAPPGQVGSGDRGGRDSISPDDGVGVSNSEDNSSSNPSDEMTPAEFIEVIVHLARSKYVTLVASSKTTDASTRILAQRVRKCIEELILPHAMQEQCEHVNGFRSQLLAPECRNVFTKHQKKLVALYMRFANTAGDSNSNAVESLRPIEVAKGGGVARKMLSVTGLVALCRHFELLREHFFNLDDIHHMLAEILQLERESIRIHGDPSDAAAPPAVAQPEQAHESDDEELFMTYAEYVEALAAIACYLRPDAFVPLATKLDEFCLEQLQFGLSA
uniref:Calponin-homology (CH) domain-containing protein n=1 Tax=Globisporangium ultimum (strain ATCC 200006 / CBS 805.95 / DAOM BR144) TaxID=431595 RepID=K3X868_GLOUD